MRFRECCWVVAAVAMGMAAGTPAPAQGKPGDMVIEPALYPVVGAPFTATVVWTSTETRPDGTPVQHRIVSKVMRDAWGRQRFEDGVDEAASQVGVDPGVRLYDPTTHWFTHLDATRGVADISPMGRTLAGPLAVPASGGRAQPDRGSDAAPEEVRLPPNVTREALPPRDIAGFHAEGMRTTTTIPAQDGAPAATVVDEVWESPAWRMPLLHIHDDSHTGRSQAEVTALVKGAPDEALFHAPRGYAVNDWQLATDRRVVLAKPSPLPAPMLDDNLAAAADRMDTSATAHAETLTPVHIRYDLTMVDYNGQKHMATLESWRSTAGYRYELHSDTYNEVHVSEFVGLRQWEMKQGTEPLRVSEFKLYEIQPTFAEVRLLHGGGTVPKLKPQTVGSAQMACAGDAATATVCFDQGTGFVVSGTMGEQGATYEGWTKVGWKYMPGTVRLTYSQRLLVEAKLAVASTEFSPDVFAQVDGLREITPMRPAPGQTLPVARAHRIYLRGRMTTVVRGTALVHVWVDGKGHVTRAEVLDADDAETAAGALEAAQKTVFYPERENGQPSPFEASIISTGTTSFAVRP